MPKCWVLLIQQFWHFQVLPSMTTSEYCIWYLFLIVTFENQPSVQIGMWFGGFFNTVL